jgi:hypothetical protein
MRIITERLSIFQRIHDNIRLVYHISEWCFISKTQYVFAVRLTLDILFLSIGSNLTINSWEEAGASEAKQTN